VQISKKLSQFGLSSATRGHEGGIASNRETACYGESVTKLSTYRPSDHGNRFVEKGLILLFEICFDFVFVFLFKYISFRWKVDKFLKIKLKTGVKS
jgi:hypothetical protein